MLESAGTFITGAVSAIGDLLSPGVAGNNALGWAALLTLALSGSIIGAAVGLLKKFSRRK